ncbi:helix-turn-helix domain-containing protein [Hymenobacter properus]|uniref:Helix-turn-helix transcriptional regulator n=1 Tax=Hymenobacter properus TaxID=2791026 RepID=A0A931BG94_9BACT|nr:helix-turn-helix transcriptional regulator [Hymenobacter properus]MBF9143394.1 helix-turn-helix transcriptional regulator [Hymenobacter properus]MBR7722207.1 helix-turn-helix transcriptional regulator [Microvirga sp. SRT04]
MFSAARIQALRKSKGYSQELLAEQSGVSLRTIQRVEQGETVPRGHTVQALATALDVPLEALLMVPEPGAELDAGEPTRVGTEPLLAAAPSAPAPPALRSDPHLLELLNLSALCLLVFPFLNLLVPYLLWRKHRHHTAHAAEVGRRVLGFQVLWQVASFFSYLMVLLLQAAMFFYFGVVLKGVFLAVFVLTYLVNVVTVGYNQLLLRRGRLDIYPIRL